MIRPGHDSTADGQRTIKANDCNTCHTILAQGKGEELSLLTPNGQKFKHPGDEVDGSCNDCHTGRDKKNKTSFSDLKPNCNANGKCHEDSLHNGTLGDSCLKCHTGGTWDAAKQSVSFEYDYPHGGRLSVTAKLAGAKLSGSIGDNAEFVAERTAE